MMKKTKYLPHNNNSGFMIVDFLFSFTMVLGIGIFIFALCFALATVEISQYIVWSTARNYAAGHVNSAEAMAQATKKFQALTEKFPALTGAGGFDSPWFELKDSDLILSDSLDVSDTESDIQSMSSDDKANSNRQPWTGARALLNLKLFASINVPFLGKIADSPDAFKFPVRAFLIRSPSADECRTFFYSERLPNGILKLEPDNNAGGLSSGQPDLAPALQTNGEAKGFGEDNGC